MKMVRVQLRDVCKENRVIVDPDSEAATRLPYLGLEQIESQSGRILTYDCNPDEGRSTAFAFDEGHVLYGKLRPYLNKVTLPNRPGRCSTELIPLAPNGVSRELLALMLRSNRVIARAMQEKTGSRMPRANMDIVLDTEFDIPASESERERIASSLMIQFKQVEAARQAARVQLGELDLLPQKLLGLESVRGPSKHRLRSLPLSDVLIEVKEGIGKDWQRYPVLGATRSGLAAAKEQPGKHPERYKPCEVGTVFYNPMRILIGSIAYVDDDDEAGITSPDYVVLKGKPGVVNSRWFYYWLRSPWGEQCIQSLARGAVRERMLFNRLAEGEIELPDYDTQVKVSQALARIKPLRAAIHQQLAELDLLPQKLLAQVFRN